MKNVALLFLVVGLTSCGNINPSKMLSNLRAKSKRINNYERAALALAHENRLMQGKIVELENNISELKTKNSFLTMSLNKKSKSRSRKIASISPIDSSNDLVKYSIYNWSPSELIAVAKKSFSNKDYEKSSQFFKTLLTRFPDNKKVTDEVLFQAGMAAFESKKHNQWAMDSFASLIRDYPTSKYFRGAKLWKGLTSFRMGDRKGFIKTVEEFRTKYRNTSEWKILSVHYENIANRYKL